MALRYAIARVSTSPWSLLAAWMISVRASMLEYATLDDHGISESFHARCQHRCGNGCGFGVEDVIRFAIGVNTRADDGLRPRSTATRRSSSRRLDRVLFGRCVGRDVPAMRSGADGRPVIAGVGGRY